MKFLFLVLLFCSISQADIFVALQNPGSTSHEISVLPGESFPVDIFLMTDRKLFAVDLKLQANAPYLFDIMAIENKPSWYEFGGNSLIGGLDPVSPSDRYFNRTYCDSNMIATYFYPGTAIVASSRISVDPACPEGTYLLNIKEARISRDLFGTAYQLAEKGPDFSVNVVPEPMSLGVLVLMFLRKRK